MDVHVESSLRTAEKILRGIPESVTRPEPHRLDADVARDRLLEAASALAQAHWGYLAAITGLDLQAAKAPARVATLAAPAAAQDAGPQVERLEALYHFCEEAAVVTLRVRVPCDDARIPSVCSVIPYATLYERELMEMFGIIVEGTPVPDRLLLPDDWPEGVYPMRKAFSGLAAGQKK